MFLTLQVWYLYHYYININVGPLNSNTVVYGLILHKEEHYPKKVITT